MVQDAQEVIHAVGKVMGRHPEVRAVGLFGSFARGEQTSDSDVDLLASIEGPRSCGRDFDLCEELQSALGREVDLITSLRDMPKYFIDELDRDTVRIYER